LAHVPRGDSSLPAFTFAIKADPHLVARSISSAAPPEEDSAPGGGYMPEREERFCDIRDRASCFRQFLDRLEVPILLHMVVGNHDGEAG
jgi:hypothetical protein